LPILLQSPVFFALFRVLQSLPKIANGKQEPIGPMTQELARSAEGSTVFGAPLSSYFLEAQNLNTQIVTVVLIILMSATTFTTQRQLMMKNMPANALDNPFAKQQKVLLYLMPLFFAFSGINFPIGVLLYWTTTNLWSMGQQFYTIRRMPAPGSPAEKALEERRIKSGKEHKKFTIPGLSHDSEAEEVQDTPIADTKPKSGQRQQPKRKNRARPPGQGDGSASPIPPATADGETPGVQPPAGANGKSPGLKPPAAGNGKPPGVKPPAGANGKSPGVQPPPRARGKSPRVKPPAKTDDGNLGL
ncbi:MAG: membrane protein insertase YidC, partial [Dermatophilaceae bacterium]